MGPLTCPIILIVLPPVDEDGQLLKVLLGEVECVLEDTELLELVWGPGVLVGKHHGAEGVIEAVGDDGQQGADRLVTHALAGRVSRALGKVFVGGWPSPV